ncbi:MAG TPA: hypothetical protein VGJ69_14970 [Pyrinomonadaceae bacterium]|jgi:hypothetical protein
MFRVYLKLFSGHVRYIVLFICAMTFAMLAPALSQAQRSKGSLDSPDDKQPAFNEFRGVRIGMATDEARKKLGNPRDKSPEQDFYMFNDNEAVQVYYDKSGAVSAISVDFMTGANGVPTCKDVLGAEAEAKADGSIYKMVRYPKAGYWVSYSRTAGNDPTITITMQKIP